LKRDIAIKAYRVARESGSGVSSTWNRETMPRR
jgi:hypothetical protein